MMPPDSSKKLESCKLPDMGILELPEVELMVFAEDELLELIEREDCCFVFRSIGGESEMEGVFSTVSNLEFSCFSFSSFGFPRSIPRGPVRFKFGIEIGATPVLYNRLGILPEEEVGEILAGGIVPVEDEGDIFPVEDGDDIFTEELEVIGLLKKS